MSNLELNVYCLGTSSYKEFEELFSNSSFIVNLKLIPVEKKIDENTRFLDNIFLKFYKVNQSNKFYGFYHSVKERASNSIFDLLLTKIVYLMSKKKPILFRKLYKNLEKISLFGITSLIRNKNSFSKNKKSNSIDIYTSCLTSSKELDYLRKSIYKKSYIGLIVRNWDNVCSKSYLPDPILDFITSWSIQMDNQLYKILKNKNIRKYRYTSYRFNEWRKIKPSDKKIEIINPTSEKKIFYAGSQKGYKNEVETLKELNSFIKRSKIKFEVVYRPHPWSLVVDDETINIIGSLKYISLDNSIKEFAKSDNKNNLPINQKSVVNSLKKYMLESDIVISPAGTLSLEAAFIGKPVILDLSESKQVTLKLIAYIDHINEYISEDWVYPCFSTKQIIKSIEKILKIRFNPEMIRKSSLYYADIDNQDNLIDVLNKEISLNGIIRG